MIKIYSTIFNLVSKTTFINLADLSTYTHQNFKRLLGHYLVERNWASSNYNNYRKYLRCYCEYLKTE